MSEVPEIHSEWGAKKARKYYGIFEEKKNAEIYVVSVLIV